MEVVLEKLPLSRARLAMTLDGEELSYYLKDASQKLSFKSDINGFRRGKAPYDAVKNVLGMGAILREATPNIIALGLARAVRENNLEAFGQPKIEIKKTDEHEFICEAEIDLLPEVIVGDYGGIEIFRRDVFVKDEEVACLLEDLREAKARYVSKEGGAQNGDVAIVDIIVRQDMKILEDLKDARLKLGDPALLKSFSEKIAGARNGDHLEFKAELPQGGIADFVVDIKSVESAQLPEVNDEFAQSIGKFESLKDLRDKLKENLFLEKEEKERQRKELEMLDKIMERSVFGEFPPSLVPAETDKMMEELKQSIESRGTDFSDYLVHIKKDKEELGRDFEDGARRRIKTALLIRAIAKKEGIYATEDEVREEINRYLLNRKGTPELMHEARSPEFANFVKSMLLSRKVTDFLNKTVLAK